MWGTREKTHMVFATKCLIFGCNIWMLRAHRSLRKHPININKRETSWNHKLRPLLAPRTYACLSPVLTNHNLLPATSGCSLVFNSCEFLKRLGFLQNTAKQWFTQFKFCHCVAFWWICWIQTPINLGDNLAETTSEMHASRDGSMAVSSKRGRPQVSEIQPMLTDLEIGWNWFTKATAWTGEITHHKANRWWCYYVEMDGMSNTKRGPFLHKSCMITSRHWCGEAAQPGMIARAPHELGLLCVRSFLERFDVSGGNAVLVRGPVRVAQLVRG